MAGRTESGAIAADGTERARRYRGTGGGERVGAGEAGRGEARESTFRWGVCGEDFSGGEDFSAYTEPVFRRGACQRGARSDGGVAGGSAAARGVSDFAAGGLSAGQGAAGAGTIQSGAADCRDFTVGGRAAGGFGRAERKTGGGLRGRGNARAA